MGKDDARHRRVHAEGLLYHVIARGNDGRKIFLRQSDYQAFVEALRTVRQPYPFSLYTYMF
jgi:putative transposase